MSCLGGFVLLLLLSLPGPALAGPCGPASPHAPALIPAERSDRPNALDQTEARLRDFGRSKARTVLIGDSIFARWQGAETALGRSVTRFAVGGDRTEHVLERLRRAERPPHGIDSAVLLIGTNNLRRDDCCTIAAAVGAILGGMRAMLPEARLVVVSILPRAPWDRPQRAAITVANEEIRRVATVMGVGYVDAFSPMMDLCGSSRAACPLFPDGVHPGGDGYDVLGAMLRPVIAAESD